MTTQPERLTYMATKNGEKVEAGLNITDSDSRYLNLMAEFKYVTLRHLAYASGASEENVERKSQSIRQRLRLLIKAGLVESREMEQGVVYALTPQPTAQEKRNAAINGTELKTSGREWTGRTLIPEEMTPNVSATKLLNLASVICRVAHPRPDSFFYSVPKGGIANGLPLVSAARITMASRDMAKNKVKVANQTANMTHQQVIDAKTWLELGDESQYPVVDSGWALDEFTADQSEAIDAFFQEGFDSYGEKILSPYLFGAYDANGNHAEFIDFVLPLPHIRFKGQLHHGSIACFVDIHALAPAAIKHRFTSIVRHPIPFARVICFLPRHEMAIAKELSESWNLMVDSGLIPEDRREALLIIGYDPINAPSAYNNFALPDTPGKLARHYARG